MRKLSPNLSSLHSDMPPRSSHIGDGHHHVSFRVVPSTMLIIKDVVVIINDVSREMLSAGYIVGLTLEG